MRVGAVVGDFLPDAGGGYTFVTDVFRSLIAQAHDSPHQFVGLCGPVNAVQWTAATQQSGVSLATVSAEFPMSRMLRELTETRPSLARRVSPLHPVERAAHAHKLDVVWFVGGGGGVAIDTPYIATVWDLQHRTHPHFPEVSADYRWREREQLYGPFLQRAARIVCGTHAGAREISAFYGVPDERMVLIPHPTPSTYLDAADASGTHDAQVPARMGLSARFFLYPANFWAHKNHVNLLRGFRLARERHPDLTLALVGDNKGNRDYVMRVAHELGLTDSVRFPGLIAVEELKSLYRHATALSYASFSGPENLPPLEAFASGCPVLNADFPGAFEQLGDAALYFNPRDPASIGAQMISVLDDGGLRARLITAGRERAHRVTSSTFVQSVFRLLDQFALERSCWP